MNKKNNLLNVSVSMGFKFLTMAMSILVRRLLIQACGNEVNGLNSLYLSVIGFLSVAELGVGSAITFCMYKPVAEDDLPQISALYHLFRKGYLLIGVIITAAGLLVIPVLPNLAKDYSAIGVNIWQTYVLMLVSVVLPYLFSAKTALFNAYKNYYIVTSITSGGIVLQYILQILVLLWTGSFHGYLLCRIAAVLFQWALTECIARKRFGWAFAELGKLKPGTKTELSRSIRAMFMHKVGTVLVNKLDGIIISAFVGVVALGNYSNYETIQASMIAVLQMLFTSLTSTVGHLYVKEKKQTSLTYCEAFHLLNFALGVLFFLGYYAIIDELVALFFGADLVCERSVSFVIALNGFVQFMRRSVLMFRDGTGTFYHDRWKPFLEGAVNVVLSVLLVQWIGVVGVILATIVTNLLICYVLEPYVLYRNAFGCSPGPYYIRNYGYVGLFALAMLTMERLMVSTGNALLRLLANGCISVALSALTLGCVFLLDRKKNLSYVKLLTGKGGMDE